MGTDVDVDGKDEVHRGVQAETGQLPVSIADEPPSLGIGGVVSDASPVERFGVHEDVVSRHVMHTDGMRDAGAIQIPPGEHALVLRVVEP